jgi:hypothetical protein
MRKIIFACLWMTMAVMVLSSCLGGDDDEILYSNDAAITAFSLGTLKRYVTTTKSDGTDSTYTTTVSGSTYRFYIDQVNRTIYNPDSLPFGTDVEHVLCTVGSKNSSSIVIKSLTSDSLRMYNSKDSIDFSQPRQFSAISRDGSNKVDYTVMVNVQHEIPDSFSWKREADFQDFVEADALKAIALDEVVLVFATYGEHGAIYTTSYQSPLQWYLVQWNVNAPIPANISQNVVEMNGHVYTCMADGTLLRTDNGEDWETLTDTPVSRLVAASSHTLYALNNEGALVASRDEGNTWTIEALDTDAALFPTRDLSYCFIPSRVNKNVDNVVIAGNRDINAFYDDTQARVWNKVDDGNVAVSQEPWMYINGDDLKNYMLPRLDQLCITRYGKGIVALGAGGLGACETPGFSRIYYSEDGGIYWIKNDTYFLPEGLLCDRAFSMTAGKDNCLWLICGGSGQVWRGRLSSSTTKQTAFTE